MAKDQVVICDTNFVIELFKNREEVKRTCLDIGIKSAVRSGKSEVRGMIRCGFVVRKLVWRGVEYIGSDVSSWKRTQRLKTPRHLRV